MSRGDCVYYAKVPFLLVQLKCVQCRKRDLMQFADNVGADQPARSRRLIWAFVVLSQNQWIL